MSTNAIDYTKQLSKARNEYLDNVQKQSRDHKKEIESLNQKNEYVVDKQSKNYTEAKANLENQVKDRLEIVDQTSKDALEKKHDAYQKVINEERDRFISQRSAEQKDIAKKFEDVKSNFRTIVDSKDKYNEERGAQASKAYTERLNNISDNYNKTVKEIENKSFGSGSELAQKFQDDKNRLVKEKNKAVQDLVLEQAKKSNQLKEKINKDLEEVRSAQTQELNTIKDNTLRNNKTLQAKNSQEQKSMLDRFTDMNSNVVKQQTEQNTKLNNEMKNRIHDLNAEHARELKSQQNKFRMGANGFDENIEDFQALKESESTKRHYDKKMADNKKHVDLVEDQFIQENKKMSSKFEDDLKTKSLNYGRKLEKLTAEKDLEQLQERVEQSKRVTQLEDTYEKRAFLKDQEHNTISEQQTNLNKDRMGKLKKDFNRTVEDLQHRSQMALEHVKEDSSLDKKKFMTEVSSQTEKERTEMKKNMDNKLRTTSRNYEREIDKLKNDNALLHQSKIDQIELTKSSMQKKFDVEKASLLEKSKLELAEANKLREMREAELSGIIDGMHDQYGKKMNDLSYKNNLAMESLSRDYELKLEQQRKDLTNEMKQKEQILTAELNRMKMSNENDKNTIIAKYTGDINTMKKGYEDQIERLKNYNQSQQKDSKMGWS
jgi:hypothetical protein